MCDNKGRMCASATIGQELIYISAIYAIYTNNVGYDDYIVGFALTKDKAEKMAEKYFQDENIQCYVTEYDFSKRDFYWTEFCIDHFNDEDEDA